MGVLEYSAERHMQAIKDEGYDLGLEQGLEQGRAEGLDEGIAGAVELLKELGLDEATTIKKVCEKYHLTPDQARKYL